MDTETAYNAIMQARGNKKEMISLDKKIKEYIVAQQLKENKKLPIFVENVLDSSLKYYFKLLDDKGKNTTESYEQVFFLQKIGFRVFEIHGTPEHIEIITSPSMIGVFWSDNPNTRLGIVEEVIRNSSNSSPVRAKEIIITPAEDISSKIAKVLTEKAGEVKQLLNEKVAQERIDNGYLGEVGDVKLYFNYSTPKYPEDNVISVTLRDAWAPAYHTAVYGSAKIILEEETKSSPVKMNKEKLLTVLAQGKPVEEILKKYIQTNDLEATLEKLQETFGAKRISNIQILDKGDIIIGVKDGNKPFFPNEIEDWNRIIWKDKSPIVEVAAGPVRNFEAVGDKGIDEGGFSDYWYDTNDKNKAWVVDIEGMLHLQDTEILLLATKAEFEQIKKAGSPVLSQDMDTKTANNAIMQALQNKKDIISLDKEIKEYIAAPWVKEYRKPFFIADVLDGIIGYYFDLIKSNNGEKAIEAWEQISLLRRIGVRVDDIHGIPDLEIRTNRARIKVFSSDNGDIRLGIVPVTVTKDMINKLRFLNIPGADETIREFGEYLAGRLKPGMTPAEFIAAAESAILDLSRGMDSMGKRIDNILVGYLKDKKFLSDEEIIHFFPEIAEAIDTSASKDFAREVKELYEIRQSVDKGNPINVRIGTANQSSPVEKLMNDFKEKKLQEYITRYKAEYPDAESTKIKTIFITPEVVDKLLPYTVYVLQQKGYEVYQNLNTIPEYFKKDADSLLFIHSSNSVSIPDKLLTVFQAGNNALENTQKLIDILRKNPVSSPVKTGGIDFRQMNIIAQPMGTFSGLNFSLPRLANAESIDLNVELAQINRLVNSGILPSEERVAEYLAACCQKEEFASHRQGLINCLVNICRLQEEQAVETNPRLKEILVLAESLG